LDVPTQVSAGDEFLRVWFFEQQNIEQGMSNTEVRSAALPIPITLFITSTFIIS